LFHDFDLNASRENTNAAPNRTVAVTQYPFTQQLQAVVEQINDDNAMPNPFMASSQSSTAHQCLMAHGAV
jgi:hypothetical protein